MSGSAIVGDATVPMLRRAPAGRGSCEAFRIPFIEEIEMMLRSAHAPTIPRLAYAAAMLLLACASGEASKYAGTWTRDLYGEGEVKMHLAANGDVQLMLPSPRWPDSVDMKGRANFVGDTLLFKADTAGSACQTADARYIVSRTEDELHVAGVGIDNCGGRRAALVGTWKKS
jgi:hypothetical protein